MTVYLMQHNGFLWVLSLDTQILTLHQGGWKVGNGHRYEKLTVVIFWYENASYFHKCSFPYYSRYPVRQYELKSWLKLVENTEIICHLAFTFYWIVAYLVRFYMHAAIILWIKFCIITWWQNLFILMNKLLFVLCYLWHKNKHKGMQIPIMPTYVLRYNTINIYIITNVVINKK